MRYLIYFVIDLDEKFTSSKMESFSIPYMTLLLVDRK